MFETTQKRKRHNRQSKISAVKLLLSDEVTVRELSEEPGIEDSTLRRWPCEYKEMGDNAFPRNGSPKTNKDREIANLRKSESTPIPLAPLTPPSSGCFPWASWPLRTRRG